MNYEILKEAAIERGLSVQRVINKLEISDQAFKRKMTGQEEFTKAEIRKLKRLLQLTEEQTEEAFKRVPADPEQEKRKQCRKEKPVSSV